MLRYRVLDRKVGFHGFNPHPTRRPGATRNKRDNGDGDRVSILTRPGGRVLLREVLAMAMASLVSILTRPGGRVLLSGILLQLFDLITFQSSPDPEAGCYRCGIMKAQRRAKFQSSPDPEAGCYATLRGGLV